MMTSGNESDTTSSAGVTTAANPELIDEEKEEEVEPSTPTVVAEPPLPTNPPLLDARAWRWNVKNPTRGEVWDILTAKTASMTVLFMIVMVVNMLVIVERLSFFARTTDVSYTNDIAELGVVDAFLALFVNTNPDWLYKVLIARHAYVTDFEHRWIGWMSLACWALHGIVMLSVGYVDFTQHLGDKQTSGLIAWCLLFVSVFWALMRDNRMSKAIWRWGHIVIAFLMVLFACLHSLIVVVVFVVYLGLRALELFVFYMYNNRDMRVSVMDAQVLSTGIVQLDFQITSNHFLFYENISPGDYVYLICADLNRMHHYQFAVVSNALATTSAAGARTRQSSRRCFYTIYINPARGADYLALYNYFYERIGRKHQIVQQQYDLALKQQARIDRTGLGVMSLARTQAKINKSVPLMLPTDRALYVTRAQNSPIWRQVNNTEHIMFIVTGNGGISSQMMFNQMLREQGTNPEFTAVFVWAVPLNQPMVEKFRERHIEDPAFQISLSQLQYQHFSPMLLDIPLIQKCTCTVQIKMLFVAPLNFQHEIKMSHKLQQGEGGPADEYNMWSTAMNPSFEESPLAISMVTHMDLTGQLTSHFMNLSEFRSMKTAVVVYGSPELTKVVNNFARKNNTLVLEMSVFGEEL